MNPTTRSQPLSWLTSPAGIAMAMLLFAGGTYLATYHFEHLISALPFAVILFCPLMHLFMHGGRGGHADHGSTSQSNDSHKVAH